MWKALFYNLVLPTVMFFVETQKECRLMSICWLLGALYGLVIANARQQLHTDITLFGLGLKQFPYVSELFYVKRHDMLTFIVVKFAENILAGGTKNMSSRFATEFFKIYGLGTAFYTPGTFPYSGVMNMQKDNFTNTLSCKEDLGSV